MSSRERERVSEGHRREASHTGDSLRASENGFGYTGATDWQLVRSRKAEYRSGAGRKHMDVARNFYYWPKNATRTTFYFTQIPDNFRAKHMLAAFQKYGEFEEVVIPIKRDKLGKRFGFARAVNVKDPKIFAVELDKIIIGSDKIIVNLAKFNRLDAGVKKEMEKGKRLSHRERVHKNKVMEYRPKALGVDQDAAAGTQVFNGKET